MRYALAAQTAAEQRQWQRQVWAGAAAWGNELPRDIGERILPDYRLRDQGGQAVAAVPYPVHPDVVRALDEAMGLGLLRGPVWTQWPAARDGRPLIRLWDGLALTGGLSKK